MKGTRAVKKKIKEFGLNRVIDYYKILRKLKGAQNKDSDRISAVMLLPPTDYGSLGDQAMVHACVHHLHSQGVTDIALMAYKSVSDCQKFYFQEKVFQYTSKLEFVKLASQYDAFLCLGADVMDGYYSEKRSVFRAELVSIASQLGLKSRILGFSFNPNPNLQAVFALKKLSHDIDLCARDPVSYQRLYSHLNRPITLVADLAFLLSPSKLDESKVADTVSQWIQHQREIGHLIVGINANNKLIENPKIKTVEKLCQLYTDALTQIFHIHENKVSFVFIPHDFRVQKDKPSDVEFSDSIIENLPNFIQTHCMRVDVPCSSAEIKFICGELDVVLTGRMHLAIAALGQCTPPACITYQGKFEGLFMHFDLEGMRIGPQEITSSEDIVNFLRPIINERDKIRAHIKSNLSHVKKLAEQNFKI